MMGRGVSDSGKQFILKKSLGNEGQIIGGGIVIFVMKSVGVDKMGIFTAKLRRLFIHHFGKILHTSSDMLGDGVGNFIG